MKHTIIVSVIVFSCLESSAQQSITKDTAEYAASGKEIKVIQTTIKQYYNDSTCVWELSYPELQGLGDPDMQMSLNKEFASQVSLGDCEEDKECEVGEEWYPRMQVYWNKVEIEGISKNLMSVKVSEGGRPSGYDKNFGDVQYSIYNLKTGAPIEPQTLLDLDGNDKAKFYQLLATKLGFTPDNEPLQNMAQYYLEGEDLVVFYDRFTIGQDQEYRIPLSYTEIKAWVNREGVLEEYFKN